MSYFHLWLSGGHLVLVECSRMVSQSGVILLLVNGHAWAVRQNCHILSRLMWNAVVESKFEASVRDIKY